MLVCLTATVRILRARIRSGDAHAHDGTGTERSNRGSVARAKVEELFARTVSCHAATGLGIQLSNIEVDQLKNTIPPARTIGDVISGHAHA